MVSTSAFGEGVNLPNVRHVVLYHMPFCRDGVQPDERTRRSRRVPGEIHLLYSSRDAHQRAIARCPAPQRDELVTLLYRALQTMARRQQGQTGDRRISASDIDISQMCLRIDARTL